MNLMILSPGRRVDIVNYFKEAFHKEGREVYTLDMSSYAVALYEGDKSFVIQKDFNNLEKYIYDIIDICKKENVSHIISLIDPELVLISKYRDVFISNNINVIVSDYEVIHNTFDKLKFHKEYEGLLKTIKTYSGYEEIVKALNDGEVNLPIFAKIRNGSGSAGIGSVESIEKLEEYKDKGEFIFQPMVKEKEFGVDAYFDMLSGEITDIFIKEKISMRSGETDKAISIYREDIVEEILKISKIKGFRGPIDVDVFEDKYGNLYINEINPRFGGGYPHAYNCGANYIENILNNINGIKNNTRIGSYEKDIIMMKYNGLMFKNKNDIINN